jgi:hypothetical protein
MTLTAPAKLKFFDSARLQQFAADQFQSVRPYPWASLHEFLTPQAFAALYQAFPSLELFERHLGLERGYGQRPHNRYYLAYGNSIYHEDNEQGVVHKDQLPLVWQQFLEELEGPEYRQFIQRTLGINQFKVRYAWHAGFSGSEVSPHVDSSDKVGTHIFYFNTSQDWQSDWGGSVLVLEDKQTESMSPDYGDFGQVTAVDVLDNRSFLFKNSPISWHGVQPLNCPDHSYRRLFNVIIEYPQARTWRQSSWANMGRKLIPLSVRKAARNLRP